MLRDSCSRWAKSWVNENKPEKDEKYETVMKNILTIDERSKIRKGNLCSAKILLVVIVSTYVCKRINLCLVATLDRYASLLS